MNCIEAIGEWEEVTYLAKRIKIGKLTLVSVGGNSFTLCSDRHVCYGTDLSAILNYAISKLPTKWNLDLETTLQLTKLRHKIYNFRNPKTKFFLGTNEEAKNKLGVKWQSKK